MALVSGTRFGPYEVIAAVGAGGMGEVYRARDSRLKREVAIKVLAPGIAGDPDALARFQREAQILASLNHPHIALIYELDKWEGQVAIAMELVEGQTLAERMATKRLPLQEVRAIAIQIATALEAAHARGIVHRDLKPANIKLTPAGQVKVLDFGLAKLSHAHATAGETTALLSNTGELHTREGLIIGTFAYMSPEQAEGKDVDSRSDIFSFGSVLYEMVTGKRAFAGDSAMSTLASVIRDDPQPVREIVPGLESAWSRAIRGCLAKQPGRRWQNITDVRLILEDPEHDTPESRSQHPRSFPMKYAVPGVLVGLIGGALLARAFLSPAPASAPPSPTYTQLTFDSGLSFEPAISSDGKVLAYSSDRAGQGNMNLWVRQLPNGHPLRITTGQSDDREPSFSPRGDKIVFRSDRDGGGIYVVSSIGGDIRRIADGGRFPRYSPDGNWISYWTGERHNTIPGQVWIVPATGGESRRLTLANGEITAEEPVWAPDSSGVIANCRIKDWTGWAYLPIAGSETKPVISHKDLSGFGLAPPANQFFLRPALCAKEGIVFSARARGTTNLWRLPMSRPDSRSPGSPTQLTSGPGYHHQPSGAPDTLPGRYVFAPLILRSFVASVPATSREQFHSPQRWTSGEDMTSDASISSDGSRLAYISNRSGNRDVWLKDLKSGRETAVTETPWPEEYARISPDGSQVMSIASEANGRRAFTLANVATGRLRRFCESCSGPLWGNWLNSNEYLYNAEAGIGMLRIGSNESMEVVKGEGITEPRGSPDGKWVVFHTFVALTARQIFIAPLRTIPVPRADWIPITDDKGLNRNAVWAANGQRVYFLSDHDGFRCIWARNLEAATKRPAGDAFAVYHAHSARAALTSIAVGQISLSATKDQVFYSQPELSGNVWMVETAAESK